MEYEKRDGGLIVPKGHYSGKIFNARGDVIDEFECDNVCTNEGLVYLLNAGFGLTSVINPFYMGLIATTWTPAVADTAASALPSAGGSYGEFTGYSGGSRKTFSAPAASGQSPVLTNAAAQASFTFTAGGTLYGAFLAAGQAFNSNAAPLFSAAQFPTPKVVGATDSLLLTYSLTASSS